MRRTAWISPPVALFVSFVLVASVPSASPPTSIVVGSVTDAATSLPIPGIEILIHDRVKNLAAQTSTDADGRYSTQELVPGTYFASTRNGAGYLNEVYDDIPCPVGHFCQHGLGDPIEIIGGTAVTGDINFALDFGGSVSGTVTDALTGEPLAEASILLWNENAALLAENTDATGQYTFLGIQPGIYFVTANHPLYEIEVFDDVPCTDGFYYGCVGAVGDPIEVALGVDTPGIDFVLVPRSSISGTVREAATGLPIAGAEVALWTERGRGRFERSVASDAVGHYLFEAVESGRWFLTVSSPGYRDELYDGLPCPEGGLEGCGGVLAGTPITLGVSTFVTDADFDLLPATLDCVPGQEATALCLNRTRFRVEVAWRTSSGTRGSGQAVELSPDTGYFWFFDDANVEIVVKVLDGCFAPFDTFWVFAAGLTDVEATITVTDRWANTVKTYHNPLGQPFEPILDTSAFATCDAKAAPGVGGDRISGIHALKRSGATYEIDDGVDLGLSTCFNSETALCLNGRFGVEASWATPAGTTGVGMASALTGDTGTFWFFNAENVEVVVKVLDACNLAGFNTFWVFAAGLTDVEVVLQVTDTVTGDVKQYVNPQSTPFQPVLDTNAFNTCP